MTQDASCTLSARENITLQKVRYKRVERHKMDAKIATPKILTIEESLTWFRKVDKLRKNKKQPQFPDERRPLIEKNREISHRD